MPPRRSCRRRSRVSASSRVRGLPLREVEPDPELLDADVLAAASTALEEVEPFEAERIEVALKELCERLGLKPRQAFQPIRVAVTGSRVSPGLYESIELLGRDESLRRIRRGRLGGLSGARGSSARWNSAQARRR